MALNKPQLKLDIMALLNEMKTKTDQAESIDAFSTGLSDIIDSYIRSATVMATPVQVAAAAMSNTGGPVAAASNLVSIIS